MSTAKNAQILGEHKQSQREDPIEQAQCQDTPFQRPTNKNGCFCRVVV